MQCLFKRTITILFIFLFPLFFFAQEQVSDAIKRRQRTILIYNFMQQIRWENFKGLTAFNIGVMGNDPIFKDLQSMASKRTIFGKQIKIVVFNDIKSINNVSLLYAHQKYNYDISNVLKKISRKNILLVTESYQFNQSMINIIDTGETFQFELNIKNLEKENFIATPTLIKQGITSEAKWQKLYLKSEKYLLSEREKNEVQKNVLQKQKNVLIEQQEITAKQIEELHSQKEIIVKQFEDIDLGEDRIEKLEIVTKEQQKRFKEKLTLLDSLESFIEIQKIHVEQQQDAIVQQKSDIGEQDVFIKAQLEQIDRQKEVLGEQLSEINARKRQSIILLIFFLSALFTGIFIYRNNRIRRRLNKELQQKNKSIRIKTKELKAQNIEMEQFAYVASHDLQEPLNTISSFIGLLVEDYGDKFDETGKQSLVFIEEASVRMKKLITALLEYSRLGRDASFTTVDCNQIILDLKKDLNTIIMEKQVKLQIKKLPIIKGREVELRLLFQNLVSNAIKFVPSDRTPVIKIECHLRQELPKDNPRESWEFAIHDNGIGIAEEYKEKVFAIFQRLHSKEEFKGTGIGLAHCKKIVASHDGNIWFTSEEGKGTTFYFSIPVNMG